MISPRENPFDPPLEPPADPVVDADPELVATLPEGTEPITELPPTNVEVPLSLTAVDEVQGVPDVPEKFPGTLPAPPLVDTRTDEDAQLAGPAPAVRPAPREPGFPSSAPTPLDPELPTVVAAREAGLMTEVEQPGWAEGGLAADNVPDHIDKWPAPSAAGEGPHAHDNAATEDNDVDFDGPQPDDEGAPPILDDGAVQVEDWTREADVADVEAQDELEAVDIEGEQVALPPEEDDEDMSPRRAILSAEGAIQEDGADAALGGETYPDGDGANFMDQEQAQDDGIEDGAEAPLLGVLREAASDAADRAGADPVMVTARDGRVEAVGLAPEALDLGAEELGRRLTWAVNRALSRALPSPEREAAGLAELLDRVEELTHRVREETEG